MSIKTIRLNKREEIMMKKVLKYYRMDFSSCVKELLVEKIEDLQDIRAIKAIRETKSENYFTAKEIDSLYLR